MAAPDFDEWVAARGPSLLRLARVLTGNASPGWSGGVDGSVPLPDPDPLTDWNFLS